MSQSQNLITPPAELVQRWFDQAELATNRIHCIATRAAQWGADQELGACCEVLNEHNPSAYWGELLRSRRRPKSPNLKERALQALSHLLDGAAHSMDTTEPADYIRRALEQLPD